MKPDYYAELRQVTERVCCRYTADPNVEAVMVTGSLSLGCVDAASDVDMMLYYRELPSAEAFEALQAEALASGGGIYGYAPEEMLVCYFFVDGVRVDIGFQKTADFAQLITDFVHKPDLSDKNTLIITSGVQQCLPLYGQEIIQDWQQQLANLPASFFEELVQKYLRFPPAAVLQNMGVDREDYGFVYELLLEALGNMLNVLCGLNGVIPPGKVKGIQARLDKMALQPDNLAERVKQLWLLSPQQAVPHFYQIIMELLTLVEYHMPFINTQAARERLFLQLRKN